MRYICPAIGKLAEWSIVADSKSVVPLAVPGVRIPHFPQVKSKQSELARSTKVIAPASSKLESGGYYFCALA